MLAWVCVAVLLLSHGIYLVPLVRTMRAGSPPRPLDLVGVSAVLYFDLGAVLEAIGIRVPDPFFGPMFDAPEAAVIVGVLLVASAPWLFRLGRLAGARCAPSQPQELILRAGRRGAFYAALIVTCGACAAGPATLLAAHPRLWESRALLGELLGPFIILLSLPMYLLAFFVRTRDARDRWGRVILAFVTASSVLATICAGQRTLVLLPFLIIFLFGQRFSWKRWAGVAMAGAVGAALLLPLFKFSYGEGDARPERLLAETVAKDFYRGPELVRAVGMAAPFGTNTGSYIGAGYVYAGLLFVPRPVARFKGEGTALSLTAAITQSDPKSLEWGFGISAISEALLNFGLILAPFVLILYGFGIAWLEGKSAQFVSLQVPLLLASLWVFGYHLPALLLNFGAMAAVGVLCEKFFAIQLGEPLARPSTEYDQGKNL